MRAAVLAIGDELLIGQVVNTNAAWIGERLSELGLRVVYQMSVGDQPEAIQEALAFLWPRIDVLVSTGGLGPTHDDRTVEAMADYFGWHLELDSEWVARMRAFFAARGHPMPDNNLRQARLPRQAERIPNALGTAPGIWFEREDRVLVVLPGVPYEMQAMMRDFVLPRLGARSDGERTRRRTLLTAGIGESALAERIGDLSPWLARGLEVAYLSSPTGVRLRLTARGRDPQQLERVLEELEAHLRSRIGQYIYGTDEEALEIVVGRLLSERSWTIAVAESCTGGLILDRLTNAPGSSRYLLGGVVAYANAAKTALLDVDPEVLAQHGAVSEPVALQMAEGARRRFQATVGIATTGIAGPTGGTPEKPVGLVWIGLSAPTGTWARRYQFEQDRRRNKERAAQAALFWLWQYLTGLWR
ncbi:MAG: competence/damage-inducible protein A [Bacteroidetes bacterium]|nr:competence/damage-inducible protein A [Rhodothermia bacterium]MCS7156051.1 competence/damage-inducible protein A [Bacteroidota bacterium]MCX7907739.1 competence/damage-inducible protein A [Bacteroidota bacterium]MDW8137868.1 competence/damage-inducible protein A [Bacteroidota bacterium]MDW8286281.1 competence/damage-inducible protein A [Bacteroidota bacterium]